MHYDQLSNESHGYLHNLCCSQSLLSQFICHKYNTDYWAKTQVKFWQPVVWFLIHRMHDPAQLLTLHLAIGKPGIKLQEIQEELLNVLFTFQAFVDSCKRVDLKDRSWGSLLHKRMNMWGKSICQKCPFTILKCWSFLMKLELIEEMHYGAMATAWEESQLWAIRFWSEEM